jgi:hypothetical protein
MSADYSDGYSSIGSTHHGQGISHISLNTIAAFCFLKIHYTKEIEVHVYLQQFQTIFNYPLWRWLVYTCVRF